ncbi:esterase family protein [Seiridium cupressi]
MISIHLQGLLCPHLLFLSLLTICVIAFPVLDDRGEVLHEFNGTFTPDDVYYQLQKRAPEFYARILPLGASIVYGYTSWDGNGLDQIAELALNSVKYLPNIILILAGTNDATQSYEVSTIGDRMNSLLDTLYNDIPGTTILVMTVTPSTSTTIETNRASINAQYRSLVATRVANGDRIALVESDTYMTTADLGSDGVHPTTDGYKKLGAVWLQAITEVYDSGMIQAPADSAYVNDTAISTGNNTNNQCDKVLGNGDGPHDTLSGVSGEDDNAYVHSSRKQLSLTAGPYDDQQNFWLARVRDSGYADIIRYIDQGSFAYYQNDGTGYYAYMDTFTTTDVCIARGIRFADMNGDGYDDFICNDYDGNLYVSIRTGFSDVPEFTRLSTVYKTTEGAQDRVRLLDIDGDGRFDYCVLADNGDTSCWRNGGTGDTADPWQELGVVFTGKNEGDVNGVFFADLNGDGRSDWIWLDDTGAGVAYTNTRSCTMGGIGDGLVPDWLAANDPTYDGMGTAGARDSIQFGRIFGTTAYFGGYPRDDYLYIEETQTDDGYEYSFYAFENTGTGGSKRKSDGTRFCNMLGHADGYADYVWMKSTGVMTIYPAWSATLPSEPPFWGANYVIWDETATRNLNRRSLHLVDWDGDGACDIVYTPDIGAVEVWINKIKTTGDFNWVHDSNPAPDLDCSETKGIGIFDNPVHLADVSCMEKDGRTTGWIQTSVGVWEDAGQIKLSEGYDRANHRWADIDGDGRADFLWMDKFMGDTTMWHNGGAIPTLGSAYNWNARGKVWAGQAQGACQSFPDLDGNGRADLVTVQATTNTATSFYNNCDGPGGSGANAGGDDADTLTDDPIPDLPGEDTTVPVTFPDDSCSSKRQTILRTETYYAMKMADATAGDVTSGVYYSTFFPESIRDDYFASQLKETYQNMVDMASGTSTAYPYNVTCNQATEGCSRKGWYAHMNDNTMVMNFCDIFFTDEGISNTATLLDTAPADLRVAQRSRSAIIIHELSHTTYAMRYITPSLDYAYGYTDCYNFAAGNFNRSCARYSGSKILCPDANGKEDLCDASHTAFNADTYSFVAAGVYFSNKSRSAIPLPALAESKKRRDLGRRADACNANDDYIAWDGDGDDAVAIGGYVHFGDSYAAGMGTGTTSTDKCRVGSNNYGTLLYQSFADSTIPFQSTACSGDTLTGLASQISSWSTSDVSTVGTVSIGGNDVGFSDMAYYCLLTPNTVYLGSQNRAYCTDAKTKAYNMMSDTSESGLRYKLTQAYISTLNKANKDDFHLYVTGYPSFFNYDTSDCQYSSFHYWWGGYNPTSDPVLNRIVYLTEDLRLEIDDLVDTLNQLLEYAVEDANDQWGSDQVHFVSMNPSWDGHRWCEDGVHEPDSSAANTWFFLSAWPDVTADGSADQSSAEEASEAAAIVSAGSVSLPDASTCNGTLGTDPDPYDVFLCRMSENVADDPSGPAATQLDAANTAIANGNVSSQDVSWWTPTRQIKTFHPRSVGMTAYRDAIVAAMQDVGQL